MTMTSARYEQVVASLHDKEYRDLVVEEEINTGLPFQIRAMRQARGWSQHELAERVGITQEGISRLESVNYGKFTLATLKRLASAFDVALAVRFVPFSEMAQWITDLSPESLAVPDFDQDPGVRFAPRAESSGVALRRPELDSDNVSEDANVSLSSTRVKPESNPMKRVLKSISVEFRNNHVGASGRYLNIAKGSLSGARR